MEAPVKIPAATPTILAVAIPNMIIQKFIYPSIKKPGTNGLTLTPKPTAYERSFILSSFFLFCTTLFLCLIVDIVFSDRSKRFVGLFFFSQSLSEQISHFT
jgi:hypothetical protein